MLLFQAFFILAENLSIKKQSGHLTYRFVAPKNIYSSHISTAKKCMWDNQHDPSVTFCGMLVIASSSLHERMTSGDPARTGC